MVSSELYAGGWQLLEWIGDESLRTQLPDVEPQTNAVGQLAHHSCSERAAPHRCAVAQLVTALRPAVIF